MILKFHYYYGGLIFTRCQVPTKALDHPLPQQNMEFNKANIIGYELV